MAQSLRLVKNFGTINAQRINMDEKGSITQATNLTTAVTLNKPIGSIVTVSTTLAAAGSSSFTCNNTSVDDDSIVFCTLQKYTGSNGFPKVNITNVAAGTFVVNIQNVHDSQALNGILTIGFMVV
jgi:hypothetical protein